MISVAAYAKIATKIIGFIKEFISKSNYTLKTTKWYTHCSEISIHDIFIS